MGFCIFYGGVEETGDYVDAARFDLATSGYVIVLSDTRSTQASVLAGNERVP